MAIDKVSNGVVLYSGLSQLDYETPIVCIMTGTRRPSRNPKTGPMLQTWILRQDTSPHVAAHSGLDTAVCGDCPLTKLVSADGVRLRPRRCYVDTSNAPTQIWKSWDSGGYPNSDEIDIAEIVSGRSIRVGAYGDPLAVPYVVWRDILKYSSGWTGYTHSWRERRFWRFRRFIMASCETRRDHDEATARGWRTFSTQESEFGADQLECPNSTHGITCDECRLCSGSSSGAKSIYIAPHGGKAVMSAWRSETIAS